MAPPDFGRSVNSISTRRGRLYPSQYFWHPQIFRSSYSTVLYSCKLQSNKRGHYQDTLFNMKVKPSGTFAKFQDLSTRGWTVMNKYKEHNLNHHNGSKINITSQWWTNTSKHNLPIIFDILLNLKIISQSPPCLQNKHQS